MVKDNLSLVRDRIQRAAMRTGRDAGSVVLVCVTKKAGMEDIREAVDAGVANIGENTVQAATAKYKSLGTRGIRWHFIGHLQTNKARSAVRMFDLIHSIDSVHLAEAVQKEAEKINKTQGILLQVNVSGETTKYGFTPEEAKDAASAVSGMKNLMLSGLMTIAPYSDNPEASRQYFRKLRDARGELTRFNCDNVDIKHLSMGMSGDFEVAIEEGADIVRVGSAIFN